MTARVDAERQGRRRHAGAEVGRLVARILDPAARRRGFVESGILADWAAIVGPSLARRCQPLRLEHAPGRRGGGVLLLQVNGAAAVEIQHAGPQLIERINAYFGRRAVRQLRLLQMPLPPAADDVPPVERRVTPAAEAALAATVADIGDATLREALVSLGRTMVAHRR
jgi:hypothetical protein